MAVLIQRYAQEDALARVGLEVQAIESVVAFRERADLTVFIDDLNAQQPGTRVTVLFDDGDAIGPDRDPGPDVARALASGQAITDTTEEGIEVLVPVTYSAGQERGAEQVAGAVIRVVLVETALASDVALAWSILAVLALALLGLALLVADRLARTVVTSVGGLAATAGQLEAGDLSARATPSGPPEVREVGQALNRLADRIQELLAAEREHAADLSHRLRTPLTALRLEAEDLPEGHRERVGAAVATLGAYVDAVISEARRPDREGLNPGCDATAVVAERADFWSALAEDQQRPMTVRLPDGPRPVRVPEEDLAAAVDVLLENVFAHTDEGVAVTVQLTDRPDGLTRLVVADSGPGIDPELLARGETGGLSTGLGLDIARRTAERSGGGLSLGARPDGGAQVELVLGPAEAPLPR
nr:ATP-binding protein [Auraticoccus cholistanensis]